MSERLGLKIGAYLIWFVTGVNLLGEACRGIAFNDMDLLPSFTGVCAGALLHIASSIVARK